MRLFAFLIVAVGVFGSIADGAEFRSGRPLRTDLCSRLDWPTKLSLGLRCFQDTPTPTPTPAPKEETVRICGGRLIDLAEVVCKKYGGLASSVKRQQGDLLADTGMMEDTLGLTSVSEYQGLCLTRNQSIGCECCNYGPCTMRELIGYCEKPPETFY